MTAPAVRSGRLGVWAAVILGMAGIAVLVALGTWQMQRLAWKEQLLTDIAERTAAEPVDLGTLLAAGPSIAEQEYRRVRLSGTYLHESERHFFATHRGATGYFVYTPLRLDDGDLVFVNRGFVPFEMKDPATRPQGQVAGRVEVQGLLRTALAEKPSSILPDNDPGRNIFYWKDIRAMAESAPLPAESKVLGFFVDADDAPNPGGLPVGGVTILDMPNNHLQYAVTWYGLALALAGVLVAWLWRQWRGRIAARP